MLEHDITSQIFARGIDLLQSATSVDEHFGGVDKSLATGKIFHMNFPDAFSLVPLGSLNLVPELHMLAEVESVHNITEILPNFRRRGIEVSPVRIARPCELW